MGKITTNPLPDGLYIGIWSGYTVEVKYKNEVYTFETEESVKSIGLKVVVSIEDGIMSFEELNN